MSGDVRVLLLADTHLGFDLPVRPRVARRRRGHDFLANYARALAPAFAGDVDIVVHAGDVFDRSSVVATLAYQAFEPLRRVADLGIPVVIVPGNHERSRLPHLRFAQHPNLHVFGNPRTIVLDVRGTRVAFSGFPYERHNVRARFKELVAQTRWSDHEADVRFLCVHHCVEGATVGPSDYMFTTADDVIRTRDVPTEFVAVLSGHIHRHQVLTRDLSGIPLPAPVLYPGSIERTATAEIGEPKGYMILRIAADATAPRVHWEFRELPARPMLRHEIDVDATTPTTLRAAVEAIVTTAPEEAVLSIRLAGALSDEHWHAVRSSWLHGLRSSINVEIVPARRFDSRAPVSGPPAADVVPQLTLQLPAS